MYSDEDKFFYFKEDIMNEKKGKDGFAYSAPLLLFVLNFMRT